MPTLYRKTALIEATQWFQDGDNPAVGILRDPDSQAHVPFPETGGKLFCAHDGRPFTEHGWIDTLEGGHIVCPGDWIATGPAGERWPIKPGIFAATYADARSAMGGINENTSDGYHTFKELYRYRLLYNAALFNEWARIDQGVGGSVYDVHKSRRHSDGEEAFGGGWFVVMAQLPDGWISNHYELADWDLFKVPVRERAAEWDGHTPADVADRLERFLRQS